MFSAFKDYKKQHQKHDNTNGGGNVNGPERALPLLCRRR
jgi:hypothetical protein